MAPSGASLTSQARAAELNAATAARARIMNGELADMSELPSSQPISLADFTTQNKGPRQSKPYRAEKVEGHEQFKRPNRPVDRYFPPVLPPVSIHPYPLQYADPRMTLYSPGPYPVSEYFYSMYQGVPTYHQMYQNHMNNNFSAPPLAVPIAGPPVVGPPAALSSAVLPWVVPPPVAPPSTPPVAPPASPEKKSTPEKMATPTSSPRKSVKQATQMIFRPQDMSPSKWEVELIRSKAAAAAALTPPLKQTHDVIQQDISSSVSPGKKAEVNDHPDHQNGDPKLDGSSEKATTSTKHSDGIQNSRRSLQNSRASSPTNPTEMPRPLRQKNGTSKLELEHPSPVRILRRSPQRDQLAVQVFLHSAQLLQRQNNQSSTENKPTKSPNAATGTKGNGSSKQQQLKLESGESHNMNISGKDNASLFSMPPKLPESSVSETPRSGLKRLQSPFQHRVNPPVKYYMPIVNKYPKNVFASEYTRWEALRSIGSDTAWRELQSAPKVEGVPGPFKGFPNVPVSIDHSPLLRKNGAVMPPPGLAALDPMVVPRSISWNSKTGDADHASVYYERVLGAEDWFHQSLSRKDNTSRKFQRKLDEERAMLYITNGKPHNLTTPAMAIQTASAFRRVVEHLSSYISSEENKRRSFGFGSYGPRIRRRIFTSDDLEQSK
ncbi:hypothetical protein UA08_04266 [Talaromyces atroroseus]|uniref:Uncharacterized protein n=1 Tax=Talaromyces atroroseus TaxID=1441469 RepID=A0A1Q5Q956_TALAT|nr:hypothetical protein UA08_04266 [Talaromyces atroroseus]OKL60641.1 hypothetical protein UA08_04266 [Talaromyces atroroseus]